MQKKFTFFQRGLEIELLTGKVGRCQLLKTECDAAVESSLAAFPEIRLRLTLTQWRCVRTKAKGGSSRYWRMSLPLALTQSPLNLVFQSFTRAAGRSVPLAGSAWRLRKGHLLLSIGGIGVLNQK